ncbi:MAG: hypothetical protein JO254_02540 [Pseudolabrys sp.]|nr:hypothetical protein [Pseudolabrys sp.]
MPTHTSDYDRQRIVESFLAQARLCDRIATGCTDLAEAAKYRQLAQECRNAADIDVAG